MVSNPKMIFQPSARYENGIRIPFNEIFNSFKEYKSYNLEEREDFDLSRKLAYTKSINTFIESNNNIIVFDRDNRILANYLIIKSGIDKKAYETPEKFIGTTINLILQPWFIREIIRYVEAQYYKQSINIDEKLESNPVRYDESLVFSNIHAIILYEMTTLYRFIIPLVTHFLSIYLEHVSKKNIKELYTNEQGVKFSSSKEAFMKGGLIDTQSILIHTMREIIKVLHVYHPNVNIYAKIDHYVGSLITQTQFTDSEIWERLKLVGKAPYELRSIIVNKLLVDIIPKAQFNESIIGYIAKTIHRSIQWTINENFSMNVNFMAPSSNDEDFSDADRFDINSARTDEFKRIAANCFLDDTVRIIYRRRKLHFNDVSDEYDYYINTNIPHHIQENMIRCLFATEFGGWNNLDGLNIMQYTRLLVCLIHHLKTGGKYVYLPSIVTGRLEGINERRILDRKLERMIKTSSRYVEIMKRYQYAGDSLQKILIIEKHVTSILNNRFTYNEYKNPKNGTNIEPDHIGICNEYLHFISLIS